MSWFNRLKTSLRADAHGLVDALEDRKLLLKQHLRDAETAVQNKRAKLVALDAEHKRLVGDEQRARANIERYERDAELALDGGRDDLARYALKLLLPQQALLERVTTRLAEVEQERRELESVLQEQATALEELRARVNAYLAETESGRLDQQVLAVTDEQIELELLRRQKTRAGTTAPAGEERDG